MNGTLSEQLQALVPDFEAALNAAGSQDDLEVLRIEFLGRKGRLAQIMSGLSQLPPEERPLAGKLANEVKQTLTGRFTERKAALEREVSDAQVAGFDPTVPGRTPWLGSLHPITRVTEEICEVFQNLGYDIVSGPEIETDFYNFEALNLPADHPARDMQDTLYIDDAIVLRTHTSPLQIRTMLERKPPIAVVAPGKVYRRDSDVTHTPMFNQIEGLLVDTDVSMGDLRGTLTAFVQALFGPSTKVRFRPSFFPFTEPSAEVDISCMMCHGEGCIGGAPCRVCKQTGWIEILGCGMVDPEVFKAVDYDAEKYTGFAFGLGVERVAMLKYGVNDLRLFFENDMRFLRQF